MMMVNVAKAPVTNAKIYIDPSIIPTHPSDYGHPGDVFPMSLKVANIENLWSIAVIIKYAPFGRPLVVGEVVEGETDDAVGAD